MNHEHHPTQASVPGDADLAVAIPHSFPPRSEIVPSAGSVVPGFFGGLIAFDGAEFLSGDTEETSLNETLHHDWRAAQLDFTNLDALRPPNSVPSSYSDTIPSTSCTTETDTAIDTIVGTTVGTTVDTLMEDETSSTDSDAPNSTVKTRQTPLHIAASRGHEQIVKMLLLSKKVDCNQEDSEGMTALMHAVSAGHHDTVRTLLLHGAMIASDDGGNKRRSSALHWAVRHRREHILRLLLTHCQGDMELIDCFDDEGRTALHLASEIDFGSGVMVLLELGADPSLTTSDRESP